MNSVQATLFSTLNENFADSFWENSSGEAAL